MLTRISLKSKAAVIVALVFMAMVAVIATVQTRFIRADLLKDIGAGQSSLVARAAQELDQKLDTALLALSREALAISDETLAQSDNLQPYLEQQPTLLLLFDGLLMLTPDGTTVAAVPDLPGLRGSSVKGREYFERSLATRAPVIGKPYAGRTSHRPFVAMTAPMLDSKGRLVGFLAGYLDLLKPNFLGGLASTSIGTTGHFFVISKGEPSIYIVHPDPNLVLKSATGGGPAGPNALAARGFEGTIEASDAQGVPGLFSYKGLARTDWILGSSYPSAEAFAPVAAAEKRLWLTSALLTAVLAPLIWFLTALLISPLERLSRDVQRLRAGSGAISDTVIGRSDEIGDLAKAFNALVLEQQKSVEALRRAGQLLDNIVENIPAAVQLKDVRDELRIVMWNRAAELMFGIPKERALGRTEHENWSEADAAAYREADLRAIAEGGQEFSHRALSNARGEELIAHVRKVPLKDGDTTTHLLVIMDQITERVKGEEELRSSRAFLRSLIDNAPVAIWVKDVRPATYGTMVLWNKHTEAMTGLAVEDVLGRRDQDFLDPIVLREMQARDREMFANPVVQERDEDPFRRRDGTLVFLHTISVPLLDRDGKPEYLMRISEDVTARRRQQKDLKAQRDELVAMSEALQASEHRLRTITDTMPASIAFIDRHEIYQFTNAAFERAAGQTPGAVRGRTVREVVGEEMYGRIKPHIDRVMSGHAVTFERERQDPAGTRWIEATYVPEFTAAGDEVVGFHAMLHDITAKKIEEQRLMRLAQIDGLTGLANRVGFEQKLADAMAASRESGEPLAVMYADIDRFKPINDTYGHAVGDALLVEFAGRLQSLLRKSDIVARLGGDEFVIVMERVLDPAIATRLAAKALQEVRRPFRPADSSLVLNVTASIGIAYFAGSDATADQLLAEADAMLYAAKNGGRDEYLSAAWPCAEIPATPRRPPPPMQVP